MRVGMAVSSNKFTGAAAVAEHWCRALHAVGHEANLLFVTGANLERRLSDAPWAIPGLTKERRIADVKSNLRALRALAGISDIIITFLPHDHFEAVAAGVDRQIPFVRAFRNPRHLCQDPWHRWLARRCCAGIAPFEELTSQTQALINGRQVASILVPVEERFRPGPSRSDAKKQLGLDNDLPLMGMVGKVARGRGFEMLLEAAEQTRTRCRVLAVGHGEIQPELERRATDLGIADRVTWPGKREDDLPLVFAAMDAVIFAAPGSDWGHRVISEAQACGRPVITTAVPGVQDLLVHGESGLIAEDAKGIAQAFDLLVGSPDLVNRISKNSSEAVANRRFSTVGKRLSTFLEGIDAEFRSTGGGMR